MCVHSNIQMFSMRKENLRLRKVCDKGVMEDGIAFGNVGGGERVGEELLMRCRT